MYYNASNIQGRKLLSETRDCPRLKFSELKKKARVILDFFHVQIVILGEVMMLSPPKSLIVLWIYGPKQVRKLTRRDIFFAKFRISSPGLGLTWFDSKFCVLLDQKRCLYLDYTVREIQYQERRPTSN